MELTIYFLFNLLLLIVLLFFCLMWVERFDNKQMFNRISYFYFIFSLLLCFLFTYKITDLVLLDLRNIPIIIGGLYLGLGPILGILTIILRSFYGIDNGFFVTFILFGTLSIVLWRLSPHFLKLTSKQRIISSVLLTIIVSLFMVIRVEIGNFPHNTFDVWFAYLVIPPIGAGIISYIIEMIQRNIHFRQLAIKSKKLEAVEQMGAAISHEIRNPLTSAMGFIQLLEDDLLQVDKRKQYLSIIKEELESAEKVIQDYLTFSKPITESEEVFQVQEELNQILYLIQPLANRNSVKVVSDYCPFSLIKGDCQKFHQCFVNVLKNAIESMPGGGVLSITTGVSSSHVTIMIQDTGYGMTKKQIEHLGEPYYSTKGDKGTGLGLMVVNSIVKAMKGTVHVESEVAVGTVFAFSFPLYIQSENIPSEQMIPPVIVGG